MRTFPLKAARMVSPIYTLMSMPSCWRPQRAPKLLVTTRLGVGMQKCLRFMRYVSGKAVARCAKVLFQSSYSSAAGFSISSRAVMLRSISVSTVFIRRSTGAWRAKRSWPTTGTADKVNNVVIANVLIIFFKLIFFLWSSLS